MSDESLFREVDEEVRQEQYKKLWERFGNYVIALSFVVVAGVAGLKGWQYWQVKQSEAAAQIYFAAVKLAADGKSDEALAQFAQVRHAGYGQLARIRQAGVVAGQGKSEDAVKIYDAVAVDAAADPALRDLARIRAGYLLADTVAPDALLSRLGALDREGNPWRHAAREIFGIAAFRTGDYSMADRYMNAIFADPETPAALRQRAQMMIQLMTPLLDKK
ncbi:MAG: tetratricopeptide repeat protein [Hyphomicrobiales bacterium]